MCKVNNEWVVSDNTRTNNGDIAKVIATVAKIAIDFTGLNPDATISFAGFMDEKSLILGRNQRNILYQRGINSNWEDLSVVFKISGLIDGHYEDYRTGRCYDRILFKRK